MASRSAIARKFSLYDIEQFMREAGAERITEDAVLGLEKEMERLAERIASNARRYAVHAGRTRLIIRDDVLLTGIGEGGVAAQSSTANFIRKASATKSTSRSER